MVNPSWARLTKRSDYLRVGRGRRLSMSSFTLQVGMRGVDPSIEVSRFGLTVTKKTGNAPARNRIKRRLRAALSQMSRVDVRDDCDYVLIARREVLSAHFDTLVAALDSAFFRAHDKREKHR